MDAVPAAAAQSQNHPDAGAMNGEVVECQGTSRCAAVAGVAECVAPRFPARRHAPSLPRRTARLGDLGLRAMIEPSASM
ncbi:MAG: hypothetical protein KF739_07465 [Cryobacterium sp.]|nr:hypothetical protein [Cryobacterium sp.]